MREYRNSDYPDGMGRMQIHAMPLPLSAMAVTGFVLGIVALVLSAVPFVNNFAFLLVLLGLPFSIVGLVAAGRKKKRGKALAIAGIVLCSLSLVVVIVSQSAYSAAVEEAFSGSSVAGVSDAPPSQNAQGDASPADAVDYSSLAIGSAAELRNGLTVRVDSVQTGLVNYDGSPVTGVTVTYANNGSREASFNPFDWKGQDGSGAQRTTTYYSNGENALNSGTLAAGGTVSGNVYFDGDIAKVLYYSSVFSSSSQVAWNVS